MKTSVITFAQAIVAAHQQNLPLSQIVRAQPHMRIPTRDELEVLLQSKDVDLLWSIKNALQVMEKRHGFPVEIDRKVHRTQLYIDKVLEGMLERSKGNLPLQIFIMLRSPQLSDLKRRAEEAVVKTFEEKIVGANLGKLRRLSSIYEDHRTHLPSSIGEMLGGRISSKHEIAVETSRTVEPLWAVLASKDASEYIKRRALEKIVTLTEGEEELFEVFKKVSVHGQWEYVYTSLWHKLYERVEAEETLWWMLSKIKPGISDLGLVTIPVRKLLKVSKLTKLELLRKILNEVSSAARETSKRGQPYWPFSNNEAWQEVLSFMRKLLSESRDVVAARAVYDLVKPYRTWDNSIYDIETEAVKTMLALAYPADKAA